MSGRGPPSPYIKLTEQLLLEEAKQLFIVREPSFPFVQFHLYGQSRPSTVSLMKPVHKGRALVYDQ